MNSRRDLFKILAVTSTALPAFPGQEAKEVETQPGHMHTEPPAKAGRPHAPEFLQPEEFRAVEAISECIIPESDTPGAKKAGAALMIDRSLTVSPARKIPFRTGLADLEAACVAAYGNTFADLTSAQQIAILTQASNEPDTAPGKFFVLIKDMTIDAYYKTEAGLKTELGWHGNTYLTEFIGCTHPEHQA